MVIFSFSFVLFSEESEKCCCEINTSIFVVIYTNIADPNILFRMQLIKLSQFWKLTPYTYIFRKIQRSVIHLLTGDKAIETHLLKNHLWIVLKKTFQNVCFKNLHTGSRSYVNESGPRLLMENLSFTGKFL